MIMINRPAMSALTSRAGCLHVVGKFIGLWSGTMAVDTRRESDEKFTDDEGEGVP